MQLWRGAGDRQNAARATQMANEKIIEARRERLRHARGRAAGAKGWIAVLKLHAATAWLVHRLNDNAVRKTRAPPPQKNKISELVAESTYLAQPITVRQQYRRGFWQCWHPMRTAQVKSGITVGLGARYITRRVSGSEHTRDQTKSDITLSKGRAEIDWFLAFIGRADQIIIVGYRVLV